VVDLLNEKVVSGEAHLDAEVNTELAWNLMSEYLTIELDNLLR